MSGKHGQHVCPSVASLLNDDSAAVRLQSLLFLWLRHQLKNVSESCCEKFFLLLIVYHRSSSSSGKIFGRAFVCVPSDLRI